MYIKCKYVFISRVYTIVKGSYDTMSAVVVNVLIN